MLNWLTSRNKKIYSNIPQRKESLQALWRLVNIMLANLQFSNVVGKVVNSMLEELGYLKLGYRIIVLSLLDEKLNGLRRIALSQTPEAARAMAASSIPFEKIVIPLTAHENLGIKVLFERKPHVTTSWPDILSPPLTAQQALTNQRAAGIKTSMVYPLLPSGRPIGTLIFSMVKNYKDVGEEEKELIQGFVELAGLTLWNSLIYGSLQRTTSELSEANEKLKSLDKLKDEFLSVAAHELRTPMTAIKSYLWMVLHGKGAGDAEKQKFYLGRSYSSTERLINLVNDMLNVSRIEGGRMTIEKKLYGLKQLVDEVFGEVSPRAQELGLTLSLDASDTLPQVMMDTDKIKEVVINLVGNSLKFTPSGGKITVKIWQEEGFLHTAVSDTGRGIKKEDMDKLFKKFGMIESAYTSATQGQGTGLGLYITQQIVGLHGGKIWVESEFDHGSTFTFTLPVVQNQTTDYGLQTTAQQVQTTTQVAT